MEFYGFDNKDTAKKDQNYNPRPYLDAVANANIDKNHVMFQEKLPKLGKVRFYAVKDKTGNTTTAAPEEKGGMLSGHSKKYKSKKKGGGVGSRQIQTRYTPSEEATWFLIEKRFSEKE